MAQPIRDFSSIISGRETQVLLGKINGHFVMEGKIILLIVDEKDWFLRVQLSSDTVASTFVTFQRQNCTLEASVMLSRIRIDHRVEKSRLIIGVAWDKTSIHLRPGDFSRCTQQDFTTPWRFAGEYDALKTLADTRRYTILPLGEGRVTDDPGGNVRFDIDGGASLVCYMSRTMTKHEVLSKAMSTAIVTHTRLSRRSNGFHTTHASCILPIDAAPLEWRSLYEAEARGHESSVAIDMNELLSAGGWMSSPQQATPTRTVSTPCLQPTPSVTPQRVPSAVAPLSSIAPQILSVPDIDDGDDFQGTSLVQLKSPKPNTQKQANPLASAPHVLRVDDTAVFQDLSLVPDHQKSPSVRRRSVSPSSPIKRKSSLGDGKIVVTDETVPYLNAMGALWYREGPRGRKWLPAMRVISGGDVKLSLYLVDGSTKSVDRRRVAYEQPKAAPVIEAPVIELQGREHPHVHFHPESKAQH